MGSATSEGVLTASGVMAYVYQKVAKDQYSQQTPHYGFLDGDGDFVFAAAALNGPAGDGKGETDVPIKVVGPVAPIAATGDAVAESLKELLATPVQQIRLDDFVSAHIRRALDATSLERFPVHADA